jgi:hypothetical protein
LPAIADLETPKAVIMSLTPQVSGVVTEDLTKRPVVHVEVPVIMESEVCYILVPHRPCRPMAGVCAVPQWYADAAQRQWHLWLFILALAGRVCGGI